MALVYDLFGNGRTAIECSLNRYNLSRTTGIAADYNPLATETATCPGATSTATTSPKARCGCTGYPSAGCGDPFHGAGDELRNGRAQRVGPIPAHLEPRVGARDSARTVQRRLGERLLVERQLPQSDHDYQSVVHHGRLHPVPRSTTPPPVSRSRSTPERSQTRPTSNLDTFDPERKNDYEAFNFEGRWRIPGGGQVFGGVSLPARARQELHLPGQSELRWQRQGPVRRVASSIFLIVRA